MIYQRVAREFAEWRKQARDFLAAGIDPEQVSWQDAAFDSQLLFCDPSSDDVSSSKQSLNISRSFLSLLDDLSDFRGEDRWNFLYRLLWRYHRGDQGFMLDPVDEDYRIQQHRTHDLHRDSHKMKAFLRFQETEGRLVAHYEPRHYVLRRLRPFFMGRFSRSAFAISTPWEEFLWDGLQQSYKARTQSHQETAGDALDELWGSYYKSTFNPARANLKATLNEMPRHLWQNMPETKYISSMLAQSGQRVEEMTDDVHQSNAELVQNCRSVHELYQALDSCEACSLAKECGNKKSLRPQGPTHARNVVLVEQPLQGPEASSESVDWMQQLLVNSAVSYEDCYLTWVVKHPSLHPQTGDLRRPSTTHVSACRPALLRELSIVKPERIFALGLAARNALLGKGMLRTDDAPREADLGFGPVTIFPCADQRQYLSRP